MKLKSLYRAAAALFISAGLVLSSCSSDDDPKDSGKYELTVTVAAPTNYTTDQIPELTVTAVNADKDVTYTETIAKGSTTVKFEAVAGQYEVTVSGRYSNTVTFSGGSKVNFYAAQTVNVALSEVYASPILIKEVYTTSYNYKLWDTYIELVNNSDEVQYLDQIIIGSITKLSKENPWVDDAGKVLTKYPLYGVVAAFPGSGKEYPLQPGESVVVANNATDWSTSGAANLTNANFEVYVTNGVQADTDFDAPNMDIIYNLDNQVRLGTGFFGGGLVVAKLPDGMTPAQFTADASNFMTEPNKSGATQLYFMMPSDYLLDAVEIFQQGATDNYHTLLTKDDAGSAMVTGWSGKSIRRKVTKIENGRPYYQDTNNSTNDFLLDQPLKPGVTPTVAD
jgi:hypothetical protein